MSSTHRRPAEIDRERLINSNLSLARAVARRYAGRGAELDDLVQVGALGLIKAADHFDPDRGVAFKTFAMPRIEGEIRHHLRDKTASLRIPRELQRMGGELRRRHGELAAKLGRSPTIAELAGALGIDESEIEQALEAERAREAIPISEDPAAETAASSEPVDISEDRLLLADSVRTLDERERRIVYLRFHADLTERQIAHELGISQAHVSRLLSGALTKLRRELGEPGAGEPAGDTTRPAVISRAREPEMAGDKAPAGKLEPVGAQQTVAKQLEVRYHVDVKPERNGDREWWTASVEGLPDCSARGATREEAVERLQPVMESWLSTTLAEARGTPEPNTDEPSADEPSADEPSADEPSTDASKHKQSSSHSGRFLVRMPRELHGQLAQAAERKHVSLNRFVTDALAASVKSPRQTTTTEQSQAEASPAPSPARSLRIALAANLVVVVIAALLAVALLVLALERGI